MRGCGRHSSVISPWEYLSYLSCSCPYSFHCAWGTREPRVLLLGVGSCPRGHVPGTSVTREPRDALLSTRTVSPSSTSRPRRLPPATPQSSISPCPDAPSRNTQTRFSHFPIQLLTSLLSSPTSKMALNSPDIVFFLFFLVLCLSFTPLCSNSFSIILLDLGRIWKRLITGLNPLCLNEVPLISFNCGKMGKGSG